MSRNLLSLVVLCLCSVSVCRSEFIAGTDERLRLAGSLFTYVENGMQVPQRHSNALLALPSSQSGFNAGKADTSSGVALVFRTDSDRLKIRFKAMPGENRGSEFGVYENGELIKEQRFAKAQTDILFEFDRRKKGQWSTIEVSLPSWSKVALEGVEVEEGSSIRKSDPKDKVYVAFGDSISHGTGQGSASYKTWPFLLSRKLDTELYNLAVGGGKVSIPSAALMSELEHVDVITLLIGYNDLNTGISPALFAENYRAFLKEARKAQAKAMIYCISPLFTKTVKSKQSEHTMDSFREAVYSVVEELSKEDGRLILIKGHEISSEKNLRENSTDPVHLGIKGAAMLADELATIIGK